MQFNKQSICFLHPQRHCCHVGSRLWTLVSCSGHIAPAATANSWFSHSHKLSHTGLLMAINATYNREQATQNGKVLNHGCDLCSVDHIHFLFLFCEGGWSSSCVFIWAHHFSSVSHCFFCFFFLFYSLLCLGEKIWWSFEGATIAFGTHTKPILDHHAPHWEFLPL